MNILTTDKDNECELYVTGRIDTVTSPELDKTIKEHSAKVNVITLNLKEVDYVSSAGLRVFLVAHKDMTAKNGSFRLINVASSVMEVLSMTGFADILNIEK